MEGGDIPKLDVMLMRSKSGNQILDIDFGGGETMNLSQANVAAQHAQHGAALVHATAAPMAHSAQQPGFANGQGAGMRQVPPWRPSPPRRRRAARLAPACRA